VNSCRPTVLLTGASGVIGASLLPALTDRYEVTALVHRRRPGGAVRCVQGDLTAEGMGLSTDERRELAAGTDVIIHSGALTDFAPPDVRAFCDVNTEGTRRILEFAEEAQVPVLLISSVAAAMDIRGNDLAARSLRAYGDSKRRAEELTTHSSQPTAVVRTALLFAARAAPTAARHQLPHCLFEALLQCRIGGLPLDPGHWCDVIPMEWYTDYICALTAALLDGAPAAVGLHWATAGPARLTAADVERACLDYLSELGRPSAGPLLAPAAGRAVRTHGIARLAQLGFQPPHQPCAPSSLHRLLPTALTRQHVLEALAHNVRRCTPATP
jgi:NAD(P)-dependent dehydrogenase (short-subunit alcohol dehydrogenase family)